MRVRLLLPAALVLVASCSSKTPLSRSMGPHVVPTPPVIGVWQAAGGKGDLNIRSNGTFGLRTGQPIAGNWSQSRSDIELKPSKGAVMHATLSGDEKTLTLSADRPVVFTKPGR